MPKNIETIKVSNIDIFIKKSVIKGVNYIKLINIEVKIGYKCYKSSKNIYSKYSGIYILARLIRYSGVKTED